MTKTKIAVYSARLAMLSHGEHTKIGDYTIGRFSDKFHVYDLFKRANGEGGVREFESPTEAAYFLATDGSSETS